MAERKQTLVCIFDPTSPRITAYEIHEWLFDQLKVTEQSLAMIQIDGIKRHVYLKFTDDQYVQDILQWTHGTMEYKHVTGELSVVRIEPAGIGIRRIKLMHLPPETPECTLRTALAPYGDVISIQDEYWSSAYRFKVPNGTKAIVMKITKHIPSKMQIAGHSTLINYEGQPITCYGCGITGHVDQNCPKRRPKDVQTNKAHTQTWAHVVAQEPATPLVLERDTNTSEPLILVGKPEAPRTAWYDDLMDVRESPSANAVNPNPTGVPTCNFDSPSEHPTDQLPRTSKSSDQQITSSNNTPLGQRADPRQTPTVETAPLSSDVDNTIDALPMQVEGEEDAHAMAPPTELGKQQETLENTPTQSKKMKIDKPPNKPPDRRRSRTRSIVPSQ
jgi:hypothetical protein